MYLMTGNNKTMARQAAQEAGKFRQQTSHTPDEVTAVLSEDKPTNTLGMALTGHGRKPERRQAITNRLRT
jgi:high-affinity K+ transport system ATPase subunit B